MASKKKPGGGIKDETKILALAAITAGLLSSRDFWKVASARRHDVTGEFGEFVADSAEHLYNKLEDKL